MSLLHRLPALDGLRAASILLVAASHLLELVGIRWVPGGLGVTVFFFVSGFIITRLLLSESAQRQRVDLKAFYIRRVFRLAPALLVYIAVCFVVLKQLGITISLPALSAALFYYANYYNIFATVAPMDSQLIISPLAVLWSLAVEEHFYFVFPFVVVALQRRLALLARCLLAFLVLSLLWRCALVFGTGLDSLPSNRILMGTDTRLDSIVYGCLLSVWIQQAGSPASAGLSKRLEALGHPLAMAAGGVLLLLTLAVREPVFRETFRYSLQGIALVPLFCGLFYRNAPLVVLRAALENRVALFIGAISYSLYLYHFLALGMAQLLWADAQPWAKFSGAAVLGLAMAVMSYYVVETPLRRAGAQWAARLQRRADANMPRSVA